MTESLEFVYVDTKSGVLDAIEIMRMAKRVGFDTETDGGDPLKRQATPTLAQFSLSGFPPYVFDLRKVDLALLAPILESPDIIKVLHNAKFDYQVVFAATGIRLRNIFDTMLAYRLLTSGLVEDGKGGYLPAGFKDNKKRFPYKSLKFLSSRYLGIVLDKEIRETFGKQRADQAFSIKQLEYAARDAEVLLPLCDILARELAEVGLIPTAKLEFDLVPAVAEMELAGVQIDRELWQQIVSLVQRKAANLRTQVAEFFDPLVEQNTLFGASLVNIDSQQQLLRMLNKLGLELEDTDERSLKGCKHEVIPLILEYRGYNKLVSTYGESLLKLINKETGRLHFTLHQLGADTGRFSSEKPNIQNIPQDRGEEDAPISFRECFVAAPAHKLLTADYSQVELRILAEVSQDRNFLEIFRNNQDLHIKTAQEVFGLLDSQLDCYDKVKKGLVPNIDPRSIFTDDELKAYALVNDRRGKTKTINFGIPYGLSAFSLADRFKMPVEEAEIILNDYFRVYSGVKRWLDRNAHECLANRYSETLLGRKKFFSMPDPLDEEIFKRARGAVRRMGNNAVIQGGNCDITKKALIMLHEAYQKLEGVKLLFTVHDEIVSECPEDRVEEVMELKAQIMKEAFHYFIKTVPVGPKDQVSVVVSNHWEK